MSEASDHTRHRGSCRTIASDGALTLALTDRFVALVGSASGTKAATLTAMHDDQPVVISLQSRTGGSYTIACTYAGGAGTCTLDAAGEGAIIMRVGGTVYLLALLGTATFA
jgi:hypothetical protein